MSLPPLLHPKIVQQDSDSDPRDDPKLLQRHNEQTITQSDDQILSMLFVHCDLSLALRAIPTYLREAKAQE